MNRQPVDITVHQQSRVLALTYEDGVQLRIPFELLRVHSPSAEVQGHGPGQEVLQTGKRNVLIESLEPVGHYAVRPVFSDGHASGLYTWELLHRLGTEQDALWADYERRLRDAGRSRDDPMPAAAGAGCASHA